MASVGPEDEPTVETREIWQQNWELDLRSAFASTVVGLAQDLVILADSNQTRWLPQKPEHGHKLHLFAGERDAKSSSLARELHRGSNGSQLHLYPGSGAHLLLTQWDSILSVL